MSGIIGHTMYAILGAKSAASRKLSVAPCLVRNWASYLCGAYLGCDIQTLPEAICRDTGREVGYGTVPIDRSPLTGGPVQPWSLLFEGQQYRPRDIHRLLYGRSHLVFGWSAADQQHTVPWDHLPDYAAATIQDALDLFPASERTLAYLFGWLAHIVGDALIKSVRPGLTLHLIDGLYTPTNRPIQDLFTYHVVGGQELQLNWSSLLNDLADTPVEPVQLHAMRVTRPRGVLGNQFSNAWAPEMEKLAEEVLRQNRRYLKEYLTMLLPDYALTQVDGQWQCAPAMSAAARGLSYSEMIVRAEQAGLRATLLQIGDAVGDLFEQVIARIVDWPKVSPLDQPDWSELKTRWGNPSQPH